MAVSAAQKKQLLDAAASLQARGMAALAKAPVPLQQALRGTQLKFRSETGPVSAVAGLAKTGGKVLAGVEPHSPDTINIVDQAAFNKAPEQLVAHEATHNVDNNLPGALQDKIPADNPDDPYNYGGADGLNALRQKGGTILDLPREQQAALVQYYQSQGGPNAPAAVRQSHEPFVNDLAQLPQSTIQPTSPDADAINTTPRAPRPPIDVPGALQPATKIYPEKKKVDLSAGFVKKATSDITKHPAGKVTAIDEETLLPIVRRRSASDATPTVDKTAKVAVAGIEAKPAERKSAAETKSEPVKKSTPMSEAKPAATSHSATSNDVAKVEASTAKLAGKEDAATAKPEDKQKKAGGFGALNLTKGQTVHLNSGVRGSIQHVNTSMKIVRIKTHDGHNLTVRHSQIAAVEDGKNDRNRSAESAATT